MGIIYLETTSNGEPVRFRLECATEDEMKVAIACPGANQRENKMHFGLPADHTLFYRLVDASKNTITLSPQALVWRDKEVARTKGFAVSILRPDTEGDPRLYPFQRVDVDIMKNMRSIINHNPMGAGKTVEFLFGTKHAPSVLIVVPKGLIPQWYDKTLQWINEEPTIIAGKPDEKLKAWKNRGRIVVCSYETMKTFTPIRQARWGAVGWDEGHRLCHRNSERSQVAASLGADQMHLLTATLMRKDVGYLFHPLQMFFPHMFTSYYDFIKRFAETEETLWGTRITGVKPDAKPVLQYILSGVMIRREKSVILPFLPEKQVDYQYVKLTRSQSKIYNDMRTELQAILADGDGTDDYFELVARTNGAKFTKLRQILADPGMFTGKPDSEKTEFILDYCEDADDKVVVFTWFKDHADMIVEQLQKRKIKAAAVHGGKTDRACKQADALFKRGDLQVIVGTIAKMAEGYDFPMANTVIFGDVSYIPDDNSQGEDRIHRPGQKNKCRIIYLVTKDTVDELVHATAEQRKHVIEETLSYTHILKHLAQNGGYWGRA